MRCLWQFPKTARPSLFGHLHDGNSWLRALIAASNCKVIKFIKNPRTNTKQHTTRQQRHWRASCERQCEFHFVGRLTFASALAVLQQFCIIYSKRFANNAMVPLPLENSIQLQASASCKFFADAR